MDSISQELAMSASAFMSEQLARDILSSPMTPHIQVPVRAETVMAVDAG